MPIVWGVNVTKVFAGTWLVVLMGAIIIVQFYVLQYGWFVEIIYCILLLIIPLFRILQKLYVASVIADYHSLSMLIKAVMLAGILSMIMQIL
jgi:4-hydroxybenzoate polyprenyltransferase